MVWTLQDALESTKTHTYLANATTHYFGQSPYTPPKQLPMHALDQTHEPPSTMSHSSMCPQDTMNVQSKINTKSTFEISCTVGTQPKFALVDMFSHASCKNRQNVGKQSTFPTT